MSAFEEIKTIFSSEDIKDVKEGFKKILVNQFQKDLLDNEKYLIGHSLINDMVQESVEEILEEIKEDIKAKLKDEIFKKLNSINIKL